jgi:hypothetical protein
MAQGSADDFKIGMLAPSGFGKTSLVTAVLEQALFATADGRLRMLPFGQQTADRLNRNKSELEARLPEGRFDAQAVSGTREHFDFRAQIAYGEQNVISVVLRDFPGAWLSEPSRGEHTGRRWIEMQLFIGQATVLLLPIDAVLVMESARSGRLAEFAELAALTELRKGVQHWATGRKRNVNEPALALICPVKCESYFADNGGSQDEADLLKDTVVAQYADVLKPLRDLKSTVPGTTILYAPVDTIGCVELVGDVQWNVPDGRVASYQISMVASYQIREPSKISRAGASDVTWAIQDHLLRVLRTSLDAAGETRSARSTELNQLLGGGAKPYGPRVHEL